MPLCLHIFRVCNAKDCFCDKIHLAFSRQRTGDVVLLLKTKHQQDERRKRGRPVQQWIDVVEEEMGALCNRVLGRMKKESCDRTGQPLLMKKTSPGYQDSKGCCFVINIFVKTIKVTL